MTVNQPKLNNSQNLEQQYLTFSLGAELYAVEILKVQEIRGWTDVTPIPNCPKFIRGVLNLRGEIVPIVDLRRRFNMPDIPFTSFTVVIVLNLSTRTVGIMVDSVSDVLDFKAEEIRPAPDFGTSIDATYLRGLCPTKEKMVIVLDAEKLLGAAQLAAISAATEAQEQLHAG